MPVGVIFPSQPIRNGAVSVFTPSSGVSYNRPGAEEFSAGGLRGHQVWDSKYLEASWGPPPASGHVAVASPSGAGVLYYGAQAYRGHVLGGVAWSYSATPSGGALTVESPSGTAIFGPMFVTEGGPGYFDFGGGLRGVEGQDLLVRLSPGGVGVSGVVSAFGVRPR